MVSGNQEVEIGLFTPLDYNLVRGRDKHLFNNESCVWKWRHCSITSACSEQHMLDDLLTSIVQSVYSVIVYEVFMRSLATESFLFVCQGGSDVTICCWRR